MNDIRLRNRLVKLIARVDDLLVSAKKLEIPGAINWANLRCVSAGLVMDAGGPMHYQIVIEEADPNNQDLHEFLRIALRAWWGEVDVTTEW